MLGYNVQGANIFFGKSWNARELDKKFGKSGKFAPSNRFERHFMLRSVISLNMV